MQAKAPWLAAMAGALAFYAYALMTMLAQGWTARPALLMLILLVAHVFEIPAAFKRLRGREINTTRVVVATVVFGLLWWLPASRGIFKAA